MCPDEIALSVFPRERSAMTGQNANSGWNHRPLSNRLGTEYAIIQALLGGLSSHRFLTKCLSGVAEKAERPDLFPMWAGPSANLSRHTDATTILRPLVSDDLAERLNRGESIAFPGRMTANSAVSANLAPPIGRGNGKGYGWGWVPPKLIFLAACWGIFIAVGAFVTAFQS
jgi:hypothetical protein